MREQNLPVPSKDSGNEAVETNWDYRIWAVDVDESRTIYYVSFPNENLTYFETLAGVVLGTHPTPDTIFYNAEPSRNESISKKLVQNLHHHGFTPESMRDLNEAELTELNTLAEAYWKGQQN